MLRLSKGRLAAAGRWPLAAKPPKTKDSGKPEIEAPASGIEAPASGGKTSQETQDSIYTHSYRIRCHPDQRQRLKLRIREDRSQRKKWTKATWGKAVQKIKNEGWGVCQHGGARRSPRGASSGDRGDASASRDVIGSGRGVGSKGDMADTMADMETMASGSAKVAKETLASGSDKVAKGDGVGHIHDLGYRLVGPKMGGGAYGEVYPVLWKHGPSEAGGDLAVVKHIAHAYPQRGPSNVEDREVAILREVKHEHVIEMLYVITTPFARDIIFEHCKCDLRKAMQPPMDKQLEPVSRIAWQICNGLSYVHGRGVIHRDLKPQNIFVQDHQGMITAKIGDFGCSRWVPPSATELAMLATGSFEDGMLATGSLHQPSKQPDPKMASKAPLTPDVTTIWYRAPEVLLEYDNYDTRVDVWAMGCICVELETKQVAFAAATELSMLTRIFSRIGIQPPASGSATWKTLMGLPAFIKFRARFKREHVTSWKLSPHAVAFVTRLLTPCPSDRMCAKEALEHVYFTS